MKKTIVALFVALSFLFLQIETQAQSTTVQSFKAPLPISLGGTGVVSGLPLTVTRAALGLATTDSPTFTGLTLIGYSGFCKATVGVLSCSALVDADIPNDITLTNITQITNRSHTSLSDIGTLSHGTIDGYLDQSVKQAASPIFAGIDLRGTVTQQAVTWNGAYINSFGTTGYNYSVYQKSRGTSLGSLVQTVDTDVFSDWQFRGVNSSNTSSIAASLTVSQDGAAGAGYVPGIFSFKVDGGTGLTDALVIRASGNVAIGSTDTSNAALTINKAGAGNKLWISNGTVGSFRAYFAIGASDQGIMGFADTTGTTTIALNAAGGSYFNGGKVGIGIVSAKESLEVNGGVLVTNVPTGATGTGLKLSYNPADAGLAQIYAYDYTGSAYKAMAIDGLTIVINSGSGGNVGIGTTTPQAALQVGSPYASETIGTTPKVRIIGTTGLDTNPETLLRLSRKGVQATYYPAVVDFQVYTYKAPGSPYSPGTQLDIVLKADEAWENTPLVTVMSLRDNGYVGIGTKAPTRLLELSDPDAFPLRITRPISTVGNGVVLEMALLNSSSTKVAYADHYAGITTNTAGAEDGFWAIRTIRAGTMVEAFRVIQNGYTGFGKAIPTEMVDVVGNVKAEGFLGQARGTIVSSTYSMYPLTQDSGAVRANYYSASFYPYFATDPTKVVTGVGDGNAWIEDVDNSIRFHIDLGYSKVVNRIYYENYHASGAVTDTGAKTFVLQGSNSSSSFAELTYGTDTGWTTIASGLQFAQHAAADTADPKYIEVTNTTPYRYYALKIADNWGYAGFIGFRRVELQSINDIGKAKASVDEYADNAAAVAAGLVVGRFYRTADALKVVH